VVKLGKRFGDAAELAIIELVDYNEVANLKASANKEKKAEKRDKEAKEKAEEAKVVEETPQV